MKILNIIYNIVAISIVLVFAFTVAVPVTGTEIFSVATPSMEDEIPEGSLVFVREAEQYFEDDVITARLANGNTFTHRIIKVDADNRLIYTKGDANPGPDPAPTAFSDIVGKVVFCVPYLGMLSLNFNSTTLIFVLAAVLLALVIIRFVIYKRTSKEVTENEKAN